MAESKSKAKAQEAAVEATVEATVEAPVEAPVEAMVEAPVEAPVEAMVEAPVEAPVEALVEAPTDAQQEKKPIIERFNDWLVTDGKTATTIKSYVRNVMDYLIFLKAGVDAREVIIEQEAVIAFRNSLINSSSKAATINTKLNSLLSFNKYLINEGLMDKQIVDTTALRISCEILRGMRGEQTV